MLDNTEPTDNTGNNDTASDAEVAATPAKKAARKAPAKRAPRKVAAKKAAAEPAVETPNTSAEPVTAAVEPEPGTEPAAPKKAARPRKAAAKKAAARAVSEAVGEQPLVAAPELVSADDAQSQPVPAKKAARKRVSKKAAAEALAPAEASPAAEPTPAPALAAPAVLFQAPTESMPEETKPARRRRAVRPVLAEPPVEQPELAADVEDEQPDDADEADEVDGEQGAGDGARRRRRRGRRGRGSRTADDTGQDPDAGSDSGAVAGPDGAGSEDVGEESAEDETEQDHADEVAEAALSASARRRRRRRRSSGADGEPALTEDDPPNTVVHVRDSRSGGGGSGSSRGGAADEDGVRGVKGSTRLEAKRQRRRDNRDSGRRRTPILTEAEFLARRESVDRVMAVRQTGDRTQIAVLEDDILVEHYVTRASSSSAVGNVYLGRVQNVLPSMEAAFVDIGRGRNGVLYAGEVNWDVAGLEGKARSIENALNPGDTVLVQVTKDPIGHKGARLTSQISLPGRFVVYVPGGGMTGISRKLPDTERSRLKSILKKVVPDEAGVIVRTAAEGASEEDLVNDVERLKTEWESISRKAEKKSDGPQLVHGEPDLAIRVVRDIFNDDFMKLVVSGSEIHRTLSDYVSDIAPDLADRISLHTAETDLFRDLRVDEQLAKALDRKVWLPSGGSLVIDRTEAMTVVDVNTGKYTGSGGNLEQTVTRNNLEAAEEIVRQLRLRDLGGIVVIDFIDMVLESNRELVWRRLTECLGRDRTKHQVAEVTSLGLVQMTRKRVGEGLLEAFSEPCQTCNGRGVIVHLDPVDKRQSNQSAGNHGSARDSDEDRPARGKRSRKAKSEAAAQPVEPLDLEAENSKRRAAASAIAAIAAATAHHEEPKPERNGTDRRSADTDAVPASAADTVPASAVLEQSQPNGAGPGGQSGGDAGSVAGLTPRPRRRRAASRPAGPPVPVTAAGTAD